MSQATTYGTYAARALIAAKKSGLRFNEKQLADELDNLLRGYQQSQESGQASSDWPKGKIPPPPEAVTAYFEAISYPMDGNEFCDHYKAKGWLVGKVKMKDWQSACRNWKRNKWGNPLASAKSQQPQRDYTRV